MSNLHPNQCIDWTANLQIIQQLQVSVFLYVTFRIIKSKQSSSYSCECDNQLVNS